MFGLEVVRLTGLGAGTVYPILRRLERAGWLEARLEQREEEAPSDARPPRVYYRIDPKSLRGVQSRVAEHDAKRRATDSSVRGLKPVEGTW
ncbi:PadR family transcriptional regulator [Streptomyces hayashii]